MFLWSFHRIEDDCAKSRKHLKCPKLKIIKTSRKRCLSKLNTWVDIFTCVGFKYMCTHTRNNTNTHSVCLLYTKKQTHTYTHKPTHTVCTHIHKHFLSLSVTHSYSHSMYTHTYTYTLSLTHTQHMHMCDVRALKLMGHWTTCNPRQRKKSERERW